MVWSTNNVKRSMSGMKKDLGLPSGTQREQFLLVGGAQPAGRASCRSITWDAASSDCTSIRGYLDIFLQKKMMKGWRDVHNKLVAVVVALRLWVTENTVTMVNLMEEGKGQVNLMEEGKGHVLLPERFVMPCSAVFRICFDEMLLGKLQSGTNGSNGRMNLLVLLELKEVVADDVSKNHQKEAPVQGTKPGVPNANNSESFV